MSEQKPKRELTPAQQAALEKMQAARWAPKDHPNAPPRTRSHAKKAGSSARPRGEKAPARPAPPVLNARERAKVQGALALAVGSADVVLAAAAPQAWAPEDRLSEAEQALLCGAVYAELEQFPKLLRQLADYAVVTSAHAYLLVTVGAIVAPRLARRGVIDAGLAQQLALAPYVLAAAAAGQVGAGPDAVSVATEPTPGDSGPEWLGQEHANGVASGDPAPVQGGAPV